MKSTSWELLMVRRIATWLLAQKKLVTFTPPRILIWFSAISQRILNFKSSMLSLTSPLNYSSSLARKSLSKYLTCRLLSTRKLSKLPRTYCVWLSVAKEFILVLKQRLVERSICLRTVVVNSKSRNLLLMMILKTTTFIIYLLAKVRITKAIKSKRTRPTSSKRAGMKLPGSVRPRYRFTLKSNLMSFLFMIMQISHLCWLTLLRRRRSCVKLLDYSLRTLKNVSKSYQALAIMMDILLLSGKLTVR